MDLGALGICYAGGADGVVPRSDVGFFLVFVKELL